MNHAQAQDQSLSAMPGEPNQNVLDVVERAEQELRGLLKERAEITKRISTVKRTIVGLANLFGDGVLGSALSHMVDRESSPRQRGITKACRRVLMDAQQPMSASAVWDEIRQTAPDLMTRNKDPMATINTILGRLLKYGEVTVLTKNRGARMWQWVAEGDGRSPQTPGWEGSHAAD
jgi:hypothetical protein